MNLACPLPPSRALSCLASRETDAFPVAARSPVETRAPPFSVHVRGVPDPAVLVIGAREL